jgi:hypothetical protein
VLKNRVVRRIYAPRRDEVTAGWRILKNEKLHNLCSSPNISLLLWSMENGMGGACRMQGRDRKRIQSFGWIT